MSAVSSALARLAYAAAPGFVTRGGGTIVNIASSVAISPYATEPGCRFTIYPPVT